MHKEAIIAGLRLANWRLKVENKDLRESLEQVARRLETIVDELAGTEYEDIHDCVTEWVLSSAKETLEERR